MKFSKVMALAGVTLLASGVLAACSGSGSSAKGEKTFSYVYETDPDNLNYLTTGKAATANITSNVIDGLMEMTATELCAINGRRLVCISRWFDLYLYNS